MNRSTASLLKYALVVAVAIVATARIAGAQYTPPKSYADYYTQEYNKTHIPPRSTVNYTIDKLYYHDTKLSPYLNLTRPASPYTNRYYSYVEPEVQRRAKIQAAQEVRPVPRPTYQSIPNYGGPAKRSQYYDHWYNGFLSGP